MDVGVNASRQNVPTGGVNLAAAPHLAADLGDLFAVDADVGPAHTARRYHRAASDHEIEHRVSPLPHRARGCAPRSGRSLVSAGRGARRAVGDAANFAAARGFPLPGASGLSA